jgi:hypothetical protein
LDLGYRLVGQSVEVFETRPFWRDASKTMENPVARATYVKAGRYWKIYWHRADLKWHRCDPHPSQPGSFD